MGEAKRRRLADDMPTGPKQEKPVRMRKRDLINELYGANPIAIAMALAMGSRMYKSGRS